MAFYSRAHYRRVSPPSDTAAEIAARKVRHAALELGRADRLARFPTITADNVDAQLAFQEERYAFHLARLSRGA